VTPPTLVLVGTGTGVGKTHVAIALLAAARRRGLALRGCKPVESGFAPAAPSDAASLEQAGAAFHVQPAPLRYADAVSPHLAGRRAGRPAAFEAAVAYAVAVTRTGPTLVETAGGLFSPLAPARTNFDLAVRLEPACWLLVAPDRLGVLHDLTATLGWARALGRPLDGVVLSAPGAADASTGTNAAEARALGIAAPLATFPREAPTSHASDGAAASVLTALRIL
jgi:dethiobiotin synthetase